MVQVTGALWTSQSEIEADRLKRGAMEGHEATASLKWSASHLSLPVTSTEVMVPELANLDNTVK